MIVLAVGLSGTATAVAGDALGVWSVNPYGDGGVCAQSGSKGFCVDSRADVEAGRAFVLEYGKDTLISADPASNTARVEPAKGGGIAHGIAPSSATSVEVSTAGRTTYRGPIDSGQFEAPVPAQGSAFSLTFRGPGEAVVAEQRVP